MITTGIILIFQNILYMWPEPFKSFMVGRNSIWLVFVGLVELG